MIRDMMSMYVEFLASEFDGTYLRRPVVGPASGVCSAVRPEGSRSTIAGGELAWTHLGNIVSISSAERRSNLSAGPGLRDPYSPGEGACL